MDTIYGVEVHFVKGHAKPVLRSAPVVKTTDKFYFVENHPGFLGHTNRIEKGKTLSFSPRHAWEVYIARCNQQRMHLKEQAETISEFQRIAISEVQDLQEADC